MEKEIRRLYSLKEVAPLWGLSIWEVRNLVKQGKVRPIIGVGKGWKFDGTELDIEKLERL